MSDARYNSLLNGCGTSARGNGLAAWCDQALIRKLQSGWGTRTGTEDKEGEGGVEVEEFNQSDAALAISLGCCSFCEINDQIAAFGMKKSEVSEGAE